jgi:hypothetical protein
MGQTLLKVITNSMFDKDIAGLMRIVLHGIYLFVNGPAQRLSELGIDLTHSGHILCAISSVVGEDNRDKVFS